MVVGTRDYLMDNDFEYIYCSDKIFFGEMGLIKVEKYKVLSPFASLRRIQCFRLRELFEGFLFGSICKFRNKFNKKINKAIEFINLKKVKFSSHKCQTCIAKNNTIHTSAPLLVSLQKNQNVIIEMKKIEELTLYLIELKKENNEIKRTLSELNH